MSQSNQSRGKTVVMSAGIEPPQLISLPSVPKTKTPAYEPVLTSDKTIGLPRSVGGNKPKTKEPTAYLHQYGFGLAGAGSAISVRGQWRRSIALGLLTGLLLCAMGGATYWQVYNKGSFGRLSVAGVEITRAEPNESLEAQLKQKMAAYRLTVHSPDSEPQDYSLEELGATIDVTQTITQAKATKEQGPLVQRLQWWRNDSAPVLFSVDQEKLQQFIDDQATVVIEAPISAALIIDSGNIRTTPERDGKGYFDIKAHQQIANSIRNLSPGKLELSQQPLKPKITDQAVEALKTQVSAILNQTVTLSIEGKVFTPQKSDIGEWIDLPDFTRARSIEIEINSGKILSYIDQVAKPYVQIARSEIVMNNPDNERVVLIKGRNGTDVVNKDKVATEMAKAVLEIKGYSKALDIDNSAYKTVNAESYDKWLVVDLTNKRMSAYEGSVLKRTFKVSAGAPATPTVLGQYKIFAKVRRQDMRGLNTDGSTYFQPNVEWTNYFYADYAIHGNYWRPNSWFGNVNSSHGCVGITNPEAQWIFEWAPVGTTVITHL